jgi:hypothetical protein
MSCVILLQSTASTVSVYVELTAGGEATGLLFSDVTVDLQKSGGSYAPIDLTPTNATSVIGAGANGTVNITADGSLTGSAGNAATVEVTLPGGTSALSASAVGGVLTVDLAVTGGVATAAANDASLIAEAIDALDDFSAAHTGTGADEIVAAEGPTAFAGGVGSSFWTEVGSGIYTVALSANDTDTLGNMYLRVSGATIKTSLISAYISEAAPSPTATLVVSTTLLFGYVLDAQGGALAGASVSAKVLATPSVGYAGTEGYVQGQTLVTADTDASGFFQISLVTGSQVDLFIPSANYRRTLEVPVTSTNVFDIP